VRLQLGGAGEHSRPDQLGGDGEHSKPDQPLAIFGTSDALRKWSAHIRRLRHHLLYGNPQNGSGSGAAHSARNLAKLDAFLGGADRPGQVVGGGGVSH
jgi:hypothetical protein